MAQTLPVRVSLNELPPTTRVIWRFQPELVPNLRLAEVRIDGEPRWLVGFPQQSPEQCLMYAPDQMATLWLQAVQRASRN